MIQANSLTKLKLITIFCEVIDSGTMRAAAGKLGMTPPAVSQYLRQLESELGISLIYRSTRKLSLSEAGEVYYQYGKKMLQAADDAADAISHIKQSIHGELRISAPVGLAAEPMAQALCPLLEAHPKLMLTIMASDQIIDLVEERIDLAIRVGQPEESSFIFYPLGVGERHIFASTSYLQQYGNPVQPSELNQHQWLGLSHTHRLSEIKLFHSSHDPYTVKSPLRMRFNDLNTIICYVRQGYGVAALPILEIKHLIESGQLVRVLADWSIAPNQIYALTINRKIPEKVRLAIKALKGYFNAHARTDAFRLSQ